MSQSFRCQSCAAPLEFAGGSTPFQRCEFCGNQIIVPEEARQAFASRFDFGGDLINQARRLKEIKNLIERGNKINAIKVYRETFGVGLKEAKDAVEAIERGGSVNFSAVQHRPQNLQGEDVARVAKTASYLIMGVTVVVFLFILGTFAVVFLTVFSSVPNRPPVQPAAPKTIEQTQTTKDTIGKPQFAQEVLKFGGEGIGAGQFEDNRSIGVDAEGRVYVANYQGGRIQVFDNEGKFLTQWIADQQKPLRVMTVDRKGTVYIIYASDVFRYDGMSGKALGKFPLQGVQDIAPALDGSVWAIDWQKDFVQISSEGKETKRIKNPAQSSGSTNLFIQLAVDGANNFYAVESTSNFVVKFSPEGKYLARFGGTSKPGKDTAPGQFDSTPHDIAVDNKGRVYLSETNHVDVFDADGRFIDQFKTTQSFGMAFTDKNELWIASRPFVTKYQITQ